MSGDMMNLLGDATLAVQEAATKFDTERGKITPALASMDAKKAELDAAMASLPDNMYRRVYVHHDGDDAATGANSASPVRTLTRAAELGPTGGMLDIRLLSGADITVTDYVRLKGPHLQIFGGSGGRGVIRQAVRHATAAVNDARMFIANKNQPLFLAFYNVKFFLATEDLGNGAALLAYGAVFSQPTAYVGNGSVNMHSCDVVTAVEGSPPLTPLIQPYGSFAPITLTTVGTTFSADMPGKIIYGAGAGSAPSEHSNIITNLPSL